MIKSFLLGILALSAGFAARAQFQGTVFVEDSSIKAYYGNTQRQLGWAGGMDNPQFATGDLNNDGKPDLVVFDPWANVATRVFLNDGTAGHNHYQYAPKYAVPFNTLTPYSITDYLKLEDYNRDGIPDLITKGVAGFTLFKGRYEGNMIAFSYYKELRYNSPSGTINAYSQASDIPAVADVDGDGDLDFFGYNEDGAIIYFFKNCQVENGMPNDSVIVCKPSNCWGAFNQGYIRKVTLGIVTGSFSCPTYFNYGCKGTMHQGNALCMLDIDGDGDMDMLDGNISYPDIQLLINGKAQNGGRDSIVAQDTLWQSQAGGRQLLMPYWPAAFYLDADGDGKKDLLISPHASGTSENYKNVAFYKNTGTATVPNFVYQNDTFLIDQMLDFGSISYPVLYDYNKDGRPDLFVGSGGYYQPNGTFKSRIAYFQNNLVGGVTRFDLQTTDFMNISAENVTGTYPAFGDLDNDGKADMVVGHTDGTLSFYKNNAASATVLPVYQSPVPLVNAQGAVINRTNSVAPVIYDIDKDGKPDLLMSGEYGAVSLYKNTSTAAGTASLTFVTDTLGSMRSDVQRFTYGTLYIGKMDNTGKDYIVIGNSNGMFRRYQGFETGNVNIPYQLIDTIYSNIKLAGRSAAAFADIDADGKYEMIAGNVLGGLNQYKQVLTVDGNTHVGVGTPANTGICSIYPNPVSDKVYVNWDAAFAGNYNVKVRLINMTGQTILNTEVAGNKGIGILPVDAYPAGIYICVIQAGDNYYSQPISIRK